MDNKLMLGLHILGFTHNDEQQTQQWIKQYINILFIGRERFQQQKEEINRDD